MIFLYSAYEGSKLELFKLMPKKQQDKLESLYEDPGFLRAKRLGSYRKLVRRLWLGVGTLLIIAITTICLVAMGLDILDWLVNMLGIFLAAFLFSFLFACVSTLVLSIIPYKWVSWKRRLDFWLPVTTMVAIVIAFMYVAIGVSSTSSPLTFFL